MLVKLKHAMPVLVVVYVEVEPAGMKFERFSRKLPDAIRCFRRCYQRDPSLVIFEVNGAAYFVAEDGLWFEKHILERVAYTRTLSEV